MKKITSLSLLVLVAFAWGGASFAGTTPPDDTVAYDLSREAEDTLLVSRRSELFKIVSDPRAGPDKGIVAIQSLVTGRAVELTKAIQTDMVPELKTDIYHGFKIGVAGDRLFTGYAEGKILRVFKNGRIQFMNARGDHIRILMDANGFHRLVDSFGEFKNRARILVSHTHLASRSCGYSHHLAFWPATVAQIYDDGSARVTYDYEEDYQEPLISLKIARIPGSGEPLPPSDKRKKKYDLGAVPVGTWLIEEETGRNADDVYGSAWKIAGPDEIRDMVIDPSELVPIQSQSWGRNGALEVIERMQDNFVPQLEKKVLHGFTVGEQVLWDNEYEHYETGGIFHRGYKHYGTIAAFFPGENFLLTDEHGSTIFSNKFKKFRRAIDVYKGFRVGQKISLPEIRAGYTSIEFASIRVIYEQGWATIEYDAEDGKKASRHISLDQAGVSLRYSVH